MVCKGPLRDFHVYVFMLKVAGSCRPVGSVVVVRILACKLCFGSLLQQPSNRLPGQHTSAFGILLGLHHS